ALRGRGRRLREPRRGEQRSRDGDSAREHRGSPLPGTARSLRRVCGGGHHIRLSRACRERAPGERAWPPITQMILIDLVNEKRYRFLRPDQEDTMKRSEERRVGKEGR